MTLGGRRTQNATVWLFGVGGGFFCFNKGFGAYRKALLTVPHSSHYRFTVKMFSVQICKRLQQLRCMMSFLDRQAHRAMHIFSHFSTLKFPLISGMWHVYSAQTISIPITKTWSKSAYFISLIMNQRWLIKNCDVCVSCRSTDIFELLPMSLRTGSFDEVEDGVFLFSGVMVILLSCSKLQTDREGHPQSCPRHLRFVDPHFTVSFRDVENTARFSSRGDLADTPVCKWEQLSASRIFTGTLRAASRMCSK